MFEMLYFQVLCIFRGRYISFVLLTERFCSAPALSVPVPV